MWVIIRVFIVLLLVVYYRLWDVLSKNLIKKRKAAFRLTKFLITMGPSFIKFGQTLSTRPDIVSAEIATELSELQDSLPPFSFKEVRKIITSDFERDLERVFKEFSSAPVAAASIAQVHKATTFEGEQVAVKITRPNIERIIEKDLELLYFLAKLIRKFIKRAKRFKPVEVVDFFAENIRFEIDLRLEAAAADQLRANLINDPGIIIPKIYWPLTTKRVMTSDWAEGTPISHLDEIHAKKLDVKKISKNLAVNFFNMTYRDGFFHGDLHPGNIFVDDNHNIILVDFGIVGIVDNETRLFVAEILRSFINRDYDRIARIHFDAGYIPKDQNFGKFVLACRSIGGPIVGENMNKIAVGKLLGQLIEITRNFKMETQIQLILLQKSLVLIEGVGAMIDPEINLWKLAEPWIEKWAIENLSPEAKFVKAIEKLPNLLDKIINKLK